MSMNSNLTPLVEFLKKEKELEEKGKEDNSNYGH